MSGRVGLAISFGGSKISVALVDRSTPRILQQTARVEWRQRAATARALASLVADQTAGLLDGLAESSSAIGKVGIAWPGPGDYALGLVQATFIPGFERPRSVWSLLDRACGSRFGTDWRPDEWCVQLDVAARVQGELSLSCGAFAGPGNGSGTVLNIATGVAAAIARHGTPVVALDGLGLTYGQWGRFLIQDRSTRKWKWRPTADGSIPPMDVSREVRLTDVCGGPAIARRLAARYGHGGGDLRDPRLLALARNLAAQPRRDALTERELLQELTHAADRGVTPAIQFVVEVGTDIGAATRCATDGLGRTAVGSKVVLAGGVGEHLGASEDSTDHLLTAAEAAFGDGTMTWMRTRLGLVAELVGAVN